MPDVFRGRVTTRCGYVCTCSYRYGVCSADSRTGTTVVQIRVRSSSIRSAWAGLIFCLAVAGSNQAARSISGKRAVLPLRRGHVISKVLLLIASALERYGIASDISELEVAHAGGPAVVSFISCDGLPTGPIV